MCLGGEIRSWIHAANVVFTVFKVLEDWLGDVTNKDFPGLLDFNLLCLFVCKCKINA